MTERLSAEQMVLRAYCAGIIDGEAYIGAIRRMPSAANKLVSPKYSVRVAITMADREPIVRVASLVGRVDKIYLRDRRAKENHSPMWVLDLEQATAVDLLKKVIPYLVCKKDQAKLACRLYDLRSNPVTTRGKRSFVFKAGVNEGKVYRPRVLSRQYLKKCDTMYLALRRRTITNNGIQTRSI